MAVIRFTRFTADPADAEEVLAKRAALIAAVRDAFPGLTDARLAKIDDGAWIDTWRWDSQASLEAAVAGAPDLPEVQTAFALVRDVSAETADLVDER
mgnify:FL=1